MREKRGHFGAAGKQTTIHIGKRVRPARQFVGFTIRDLRVHRAKQRADHRIGVAGLAVAHLLDRSRENLR